MKLKRVLIAFLIVGLVFGFFAVLSCLHGDEDEAKRSDDDASGDDTTDDDADDDTDDDTDDDSGL